MTDRPQTDGRAYIMYCTICLSLQYIGDWPPRIIKIRAHRLKFLSVFNYNDYERTLYFENTQYFDVFRILYLKYIR